MAHQIILKEEVYQKIKEKCLSFYGEKRKDIFAMQQEIMDFPEIPMHYPYHHFILPAVLLTAADVCAGQSEETLRAQLESAEERARNVLGGFCGFYRTCGAPVKRQLGDVQPRDSGCTACDLRGGRSPLLQACLLSGSVFRCGINEEKPEH